MFQAGGLVVVLVEVARKPYLASLVPVIVNAILMEHQIIVDIVAFVNKGDFPRSRLGEKQRGKLLAGWVTRKMRTLAQFAIRDLDPRAMGDVAEDAGVSNRHSMLSARSFGGGQAGASSLRNVEQAPRIMEQEEFEQQMDRIADMAPAEAAMGMPDDQKTPTGYQLHDGPPLDAAAPQAPPSQQYQQAEPQHHAAGNAEQQHQRQSSYNFDNDFERFGTPGPPPVGPKPGSRSAESQAPPQIRLPGVDGRENIDFWSNDEEESRKSWEADAIMHMNLMGDMGGPRQS